MPRITTTDVREIADVDVSEEALHAFIEDAHRVVNERVAPHTDDKSALSAVESYLAAHLATSEDPRVQSVAHESVSFEYSSEQGQKYWHNAIMMDPTGRLARPSGYPVVTAD